MSKFYVGQKVLVVDSTHKPQPWTKEMIGNVCELKEQGDRCAVFTPDKSDYWYFNESDLQPITETPETLTINGVEYVRKPEPEHEWKFGDVAVHDVYGVGIVAGVDDELEFHFNDGNARHFFSHSSLTFLRRTDFSV